MIHCKDCRYFEERDGITPYDGRCLLIPPWLAECMQTPLGDHRVNETDGCDLGQPKEEKGE